MEKNKKQKCYNCKFSGVAFKIGKLTHCHCEHPDENKLDNDGDPPSPWDTLRVFSDTCKLHQFHNTIK